MTGGCRVHACAPTNVAVCEIARRYVKELTKIIHIDSSDDNKGQSNPFRLADLVIVGNSNRLKIDDSDPLHDLLLENRINLIEHHCSTFDLNRLNYLQFLREKYLYRLPKSDEESSDSSDQVIEIPVAQLVEIFKKFTILITDNISTLLSDAPYNTLKGKHVLSIKSKLMNILSSTSDSLITEWIKCDQIDNKNQELVKFNDDLRSIQTNLSTLIVMKPKNLKAEVMRSAMVVFSTVNVSGRELFDFIAFDVVVMDEATQLVQAECSIVLRRLVKCLVLVGDEKQLPSTVFSPHSSMFGYNESLFERLLSIDYPFSLLNTQYRMHPDISRFPRMQFYEGKLVDGENVISSAYTKEWHSIFPPMAMFNMNVSNEETDDFGSKYNEGEAMLVRQIVAKIRSFKCNLSVGIISPYKAQIALLQHLGNSTSSDTFNAQQQTGVQIRVATVDSFQGQECDIIIFTTVRSNKDAKIGFLKDQRRLNVAITRARFSLLIVGNMDILELNQNWDDLVAHSRENDSLHDSDNNETIKKATTKWNHSDHRISTLMSNKNIEMFEKMPWKAVMKNEFQAAFTKLDAKCRHRVMVNIINIVQGKWPKYELKSQFVSEKYKDIIHTTRSLNQNILWSVDISLTSYSQCACFWNIASDSKLADSIYKIERQFVNYTGQYLSRCSEKSKVGNKFIPIAWSQNIEFIRCEKAGVSSKKVQATDEKLSVKSSSTISMKSYLINSNVARLLMSSFEGTQIELPFEMSEQENQIVRHDGSIMIIGRSGTGKTTTMLHRMFFSSECSKAINSELYRSDPHNIDKHSKQLKKTTYRQLLVTASPILCEAIQNSYSKMCSSASMCADTLNEGSSNLNFSEKGESIARVTPPAFSDCQDSDYPLIITFRKFIDMLDKSISSSFFNQFSHAIRLEMKEVMFERFISHYYSHFDDKTKIVDPALLFTEIMSHIKGSQRSLNSVRGYLSQEEYIQLSESRQSSLNENKRRLIYEAFEKYERMKSQKFEYDLLDIVCYLHNYLSNNGYSGPFMDNIFIDEIQDLCPAEIALFKFVSINPKGFFFAGDTAQTVCVIYSFDISSLIQYSGI